MSIYDEAKVITHEEARKKVNSNHNKFYTEGEFTKDMLDYIAQQEKVSKLLELYQLKNNLLGDVAHERMTVKAADSLIMATKEEIEALEEELK